MRKRKSRPQKPKTEKKMLKGKTVLVGVCGGIAAYKACELISLLKTAGAEIYTMMTRAACEFITPLTLGTLTNRNVACDMFAVPENYEVEHISLAKRADAVAIIPATANIIGKIACGIADDFVSTTVMATKAPVIVAPAMNTGMYENPVVGENIQRLKKRGFRFVEPSSGRLACGDEGKGHLAPVEDIFEEIVKSLTPQTLSGKNVLVTAGPTREKIDPVRFISNRSTGKMGYAIARAAYLRGASVTLVSGPSALACPVGVERINVESALDMHHEVMERAAAADIIVKAAAVGDFRPEAVSGDKIKKDKMGSITLTKNPDILAELGSMGLKAKIVGFSMETKDMEKNSVDKLKRKNADYIVANNLKTEGAGFAGDTNVVTVFSKSGKSVSLPKMSKLSLAGRLLDMVTNNELC